MRGQDLGKYGKWRKLFASLDRVNYMESKLSQKYDKKVFVNLFEYF